MQIPGTIEMKKSKISFLREKKVDGQWVFWCICSWKLKKKSPNNSIEIKMDNIYKSRKIKCPTNLAVTGVVHCNQFASSFTVYEGKKNSCAKFVSCYTAKVIPCIK